MIPEEYVENFYKKYSEEFNKNTNFSYVSAIWPSRIEDGVALIKIIEKYNIQSILEVGTWMGWSGLLMAEHPNIKKFKAIDIHKDMNISYFNPSHLLSEKEEIGKMLKFSDKTELEFCNSLKWKSDEKFDMVFIDANHDYEYVKHDTENIGLKNATKIIAWHDYPNESGVTDYLNQSGLNFQKMGGVVVYYEI